MPAQPTAVAATPAEGLLPADTANCIRATAHREAALKSLATFKLSSRPREKRVEISSGFSDLTLYVDTRHPQAVRYQLRAGDGAC